MCQKDSKELIAAQYWDIDITEAQKFWKLFGTQIIKDYVASNRLQFVVSQNFT